MERINFNSDALEGNESIMFVNGLDVYQIRFNHDTKEIFVLYEPIKDVEIRENVKFTEEDLSKLRWNQVKKLVVDNGGEWTNTKEGREYLLGL